MAQGARQSSLFAAEDFSVVYESFSEANFQAYDFETIRNTMVDYINNNYPESYNDWINSSEFVSLIELMAFLGHNLAFRADLGQRDNYLSTAERRDSALRIANFLGYAPSRHVVANGFLKVDSVRTTEAVFDSNGNSLASTSVLFEDTTDPNSYQNFLTIMNAIFQSSSQFGAPFSKVTINGVSNEVYRTNSTNNIAIRGFTNTVNNRSTDFGFYSVKTTPQNTVIEKNPDPYGVVDILYKNDNSGNSSPNTGFFVGFKQGTLQYKDFNITNGLPNMVLDIDANNIASGNVWVQTIDEVGQVQKNWTRVDKLFGNSAVVNSLNNNIRDIFTVASRENDQISIVFGDGDFANVPRGNIRVWYRTGLNASYTLNPDNFGSVAMTIDYVGVDLNIYQATFNLSLKSNVTNASTSESIASIKANAPRFFATQDRMVTADDYNIFPATVSENISKIKSINRVHSGHSRFRDLYDPTATYNDATQYTDDGYLYENNVTQRNLVTLPSSLNGEQIYKTYIKPLLSNPEVKNFYYNRHGYTASSYSSVSDFSNTTDGITVVNSTVNDITNVFRWNQITKGSNGCSGYFTYNSIVQRTGLTQTNSLQKASLNSLVEFISSPYKMGYISSATVNNGGTGYTGVPTVTITGAGSGATAIATVTSGVVTAIAITNSGSGYDASTVITLSGGGGSNATASVTITDAPTKWVKVNRLYKDGLGDDDTSGSPTGIDNAGKGAVVLSGIVDSSARVKRIVPQIDMDLTSSIKTQVITKLDANNSFALRYNTAYQQWYIIESGNIPANTTTLNDVSSWSRQYEGDTSGTGIDNSWIIRINYSSTQWEILTRKTQMVFGSTQKLKFSNLNFASTFSSETQKPLRDCVKVLRINPTSDTNAVPLGQDYKFNLYGYYTYQDGYTDPHNVRLTLADPDNDDYPTNPESFNNVLASQTIRLGTKTVDGFTYTTYDTSGTTVVNGKANLHTQYDRISDINNVIDPAITNIVDTYVLLESYDTLFRAWAAYDGRPETKPSPPSISELTNLFESLETKKSISDQVIYRPVKYKILFGDLASSELQARFNVTRTSNSTMSATEIKQRVIKHINDYFAVENWDFGEDFYFTEMAAYIHNNMIGEISQITISPVGSTTDSQELFEINSSGDELFLPVVQASNISVTNSIVSNSTSIAESTGVSITGSSGGTSSGSSY